MKITLLPNLIFSKAGLASYNDVNLFDDGSHISVLYDWFPPNIAACYECAVQERPWEAAHIGTIVQWFSRLDLDVALFAQLAGHLSFEDVREGVKRATLECCKADKPVTELAILQTLYSTTVVYRRHNLSFIFSDFQSIY